ncbi:MAG: aminopeptidase P family N-terminal domain-containing protein, partial [Pseudomonadota bacterium]
MNPSTPSGSLSEPTTQAAHLHFSTAEFAGRRRAACAAMSSRGIDALLMFRQESMYYLTGYDTFGYVYFQCMVLTADGR